jgi:hypothetical protein
MKRRALLVNGGQALVFGLAVRATPSGLLSTRQELQDSLDTLEQRVAAVIQDYDAQGNHRTGTEVDRASAEWLANRLRHLGAEPSLEPFTLSRIDPQSCYLRVAGRRIDSLPLFDAGFTGSEGVHGRLGHLGSDAEIALIESEPPSFSDPGIEQREQVQEARHSRHKAIVVLTRGPRPGLFLINARGFTKPFGPPMLQISTAESAWLKDHAELHAEATLVAEIRRTTAQAYNVAAKIPGSNPALAPLVFMVPRSGWWQCASEQGSRLACWLEVVRVLAAAKPVRDSFFVAFSGHEVGFLGVDPYIKARPDLITHAHAWIFFGSDIGAPRQPNVIHASEDALEQWAVATLEKEGLTVNTKVRHNSSARGEVSTVQQGGGRFVTVACDTEVFHNIADRWPQAIDVGTVARYAKAFANGALQLARQGA